MLQQRDKVPLHFRRGPHALYQLKDRHFTLSVLCAYCLLEVCCQGPRFWEVKAVWTCVQVQVVPLPPPPPEPKVHFSFDHLQLFL